jgi:DNA damage-inducible protein 1
MLFVSNYFSAKFSKMIKDMETHRLEREEQRMRLLSANPFDAEAQQLIAEEIRQKNIEANMEAAMEYNPESFGTVVMLYIDCKVNGHPLKAFVDSGKTAIFMKEHRWWKKQESMLCRFFPLMSVSDI